MYIREKVMCVLPVAKVPQWYNGPQCLAQPCYHPRMQSFCQMTLWQRGGSCPLSLALSPSFLEHLLYFRRA